MSEKLRVVPTSRKSAEVGDIVLRKLETRRLVFRPLLVNNVHDQEAAIRGAFIYQRKRQGEGWEDYKELDLTQLRAEEWIKLELRSAEVLTLFRELEALYALYEQEGIPADKTEYTRTASSLNTLLETTDDGLHTLLQTHGEEASEILARLLAWTLSLPNPAPILSSLEQLETDDLRAISSLAGLRILQDSLRLWQENQESNDERFWQNMLGEHAFVLTQIFAYPVVILEDEAYVGGKSITNRGGNLVDFLVQNQVSQNVVLIEIKTPTTPLLGTSYRTNAYTISGDVSGAVVQITNYRDSLMAEYNELQSNTAVEFRAFEPACVVIAGNFATQLTDEVRRRSFELFRSQLKSVQLITYDELFGKVQLLVDLLEGEGTSGPEEEREDDIPF